MNNHNCKEKIIIFGASKTLLDNIEKVDLDKVVAIIDNDCLKINTYINDILICSPDILRSVEYDYIVIFSKYGMQNIYYQLVQQYYVSPNRIMSFSMYLFYNTKDYFSKKIINLLPRIFETHNILKVCDYGTRLAQYGITNRDFFCKNENILFLFRNNKFDIKGINDAVEFEIFNNLYSEVVNKDTYKNNTYDMILFLDYFLIYDWETMEEKIREALAYSSSILITIPDEWQLPNHFEGWNEKKFRQLGNIEYIVMDEEKAVIISKPISTSKCNDIKLFTVTHKRYNAIEDNIRIPLHAGRIRGKELGYIGDNSGDNISIHNKKINECTAMYWIWKNVDCKYVGIEHYRRYLIVREYYYGGSSMLNKQDILEYMKSYDILISKAVNLYPLSIGEELKRSIHPEAYEVCFRLIRNRINKTCREYMIAFDRCFNGYTFFPCNLFVTRKEIMNQYCEWLFDIILPIIDQINVEEYDEYSQRVLGFFAERMLTVWLLKQDYKLKELGYRMVE